MMLRKSKRTSKKYYGGLTSKIMRRKYDRKDYDYVPAKDYSWKCLCGKNSDINIGAWHKDNPMPCIECYAKILKKQKN